MSRADRKASGMEWKIKTGIVIALLFLVPAALFAQEGVPAGIDDGGPFWVKALLALAVVAILFVVATLAVGVYLLVRAKKLIDKTLRPDLPKLIQAAEKLEQRGYDKAEITRKLIHREANRAGVVGLLTGVGGLPTLPITVPVDLLATLRIQANMVRLIGLLHGADSTSKEISDMGLWVVTAGSQQATAVSGTVLRQFLVKGLSKSALKIVPLLGGVIGYALNWSSTQAMGRMAIRYYTDDWQVPKTRDAISGAATKAQAVLAKAGRVVAAHRRIAAPETITEDPAPVTVPPPLPSVSLPIQEVSPELLSQPSLDSRRQA